MNKNILVIATYFPPMAGIGVVRVTKYIKYLKRFGWNPIVITISDKFIKDRDDSFLKDISSDTEIYRIDFKIKNRDISKDFYFSLKKNINQILINKRIDAVFITGGPFYILPIGRYIKRHFKIPYVIDLRDPWKLQRINKNTRIVALKGYVKRFIDGLLERYTLKKANAIFTVDDIMTEEYINEYPKLKNKIYTISNGYDEEDFQDVNKKEFDKFTIIYSGKFSVSAGFRDPSNFFKALCFLKQKNYEIEFIHIGSIEDKIIELAKKENVYDICKFIGYQKYKNVLSYLKGADALLIIGGTEKNEQTGKIFDYIGSDRSIVAMLKNKGELYKICNQLDNAYIVYDDNIDEITKIIQLIYNKKDNTATHCNILKEENKYSRESLTKKLITILEKEINIEEV